MNSKLMMTKILISYIAMYKQLLLTVTPTAIRTNCSWQCWASSYVGLKSSITNLNGEYTPVNGNMLLHETAHNGVGIGLQLDEMGRVVS